MATSKETAGTNSLLTKEQAIELADKYLLYTSKFALKDYIFARSTDEVWEITAITMPVIIGMKTEISSFDIDKRTGEVGASITQIVLEDRIEQALSEMRRRKDIDQTKKDLINAKIEELKKPSNITDKKKMAKLKKWFVDNAPYMKSVIDLITAILGKLQ